MAKIKKTILKSKPIRFSTSTTLAKEEQNSEGDQIKDGKSDNVLIKRMKRLKLMIVQKPASNTIELIVIDLDNGKDFVEELEVKKYV